MLDALDITEAEARGLSELAEHDLALARDFARRAQAAQDSEEAGRLGRSYQRAARSYRQTLALKARLKRELAQAGAAAQVQAGAAAAQAQAHTPRPKPGAAALARRIGEMREALLRLAWNEAEADEREPADEAGAPGAGEDLGEDLGAEDPVEVFAWVRRDMELVLAEDSLKDHFGEEPLDDHVARLAVELGFPLGAIARWRDLPDPPKALLEVEPEDLDWPSSA